MSEQEPIIIKEEEVVEELTEEVEEEVDFKRRIEEDYTRHIIREASVRYTEFLCEERKLNEEMKPLKRRLQEIKETKNVLAACIEELKNEMMNNRQCTGSLAMRLDKYMARNCN